MTDKDLSPYYCEAEQRLINPTVTPQAIRDGLKALAKQVATTREPYKLRMDMFDMCTDLGFITKTLTAAYLRVTMNRVPEMAAIGSVKLSYDRNERVYTVDVTEGESRESAKKREAIGKSSAIRALKDALKIRIDLMDVDIDDMPATKRAVELYRAEIQLLIDELK